MSTPSLTTAARGDYHLGQRRRRTGEWIVKKVLALAAGLSILTTVGIVLALAIPTIGFFREVSIGSFLFGTEWTPNFSSQKFGVLPLIAGTMVITLIAIAIAIPLGLGAAIYLSEYASQRTRKILKPLLEILAGIPTVVFGFFALTFVTPILRDIWPFGDPPAVFNGLSAGLVMGIMIIPTIASLSEDAMSAVPQSLRAGGLALGSSKLQVSTRIVLPAALSGIVAAFVLGISRAIGETMIVAVAAGSSTKLSFNPLEPMSTMTSFIAASATGDLSQGSIQYQTIFAVGALLFILTFAMNMIATRLVRRYRQVYE